MTYCRRQQCLRVLVRIPLSKTASYAYSLTKKNPRNASVHCTVLCIVLRHIIIMVICTSSSSSELSINQNGASMVKAKNIYFLSVTLSDDHATEIHGFNLYFQAQFCMI